MRKFLLSIAVIAMPYIMWADADSLQLVVEDNSSAVTNSVTSKKISGYIEYVYIDVTAPATQTVTVASGDATILTATAVTADTLYRVRFPVSDAAGATVGSVTNHAVRHLLANETVTVTVTSTQTNVLDTGVKIKLDNDK